MERYIYKKNYKIIPKKNYSQGYKREKQSQEGLSKWWRKSWESLSYYFNESDSNGLNISFSSSLLEMHPETGQKFNVYILRMYNEYQPLALFN